MSLNDFMVVFNSLIHILSKKINDQGITLLNK